MGVTRSGLRALPPSSSEGYAVDHLEVALGEGPATFERARQALLRWGPFDSPWLELHGAADPVEAGAVVATTTRAAGLWVLNACRVVYVADDAPRCTAWAYGTLEGHAVRGEERFQVVRDPHSDLVSYQVLAVSRPHHLLARLGTPWVRRLQARFRSDSAAALQRHSQEPA